jgi:hypothetical protein
MATTKKEEVTPIETETEFLNRLLSFMHDGGWGKQLDPMILERVKLVNEWDIAYIEKGNVIQPPVEEEDVLKEEASEVKAPAKAVKKEEASEVKK